METFSRVLVHPIDIHDLGGLTVQGDNALCGIADRQSAMRTNPR
jgi:hypothetical protein